MPEHFQVSPPCRTAAPSICHLSETSTDINVSGHDAGTSASGVLGQNPAAARALSRRIDGGVLTEQLISPPQTMERPHAPAGQPTRVDQCRASGGEAASLGGVAADRAGVDPVSVPGDSERAGPVARSDEREREVKPYQFSHHTEDGLAVYVDEPAVMHRIPAAPATIHDPLVRECLTLFRTRAEPSNGIHAMAAVVARVRAEHTAELVQLWSRQSALRSGARQVVV